MADFSTNTVTSTASLEYLVGKTVDTVLTYSPATLFFLGNQRPWKGTKMRIGVKYAKNTEGRNFTGLEKFSTTRVTQFANMTFDPTGYEQPSIISQMEVDVADTNRIIDIVARQMASDAQDMASAVADQFYTVQTGDAFLSLIDASDDGTLASADTYGTLARNTYGLNGNYTGTVGNLTLATMRTSFDNATHGKDSPNLILCPKAVFGYYEKLITPTVQHNFDPSKGYPSFVGATAAGLPNLTAPGQTYAGGQGFRALYWNGVPIIADEVSPAGYMFMVNTRNTAFYGVPSTKEGYKPVKFSSDTVDSVYNVPVTTGFSWSGFITPIDQYGAVGHIILMGNLICDQPRNQALLTGITGA